MGDEVQVEIEELRRAARVLADTTVPLDHIRARVSAAARTVAGAGAGPPLSAAALEFGDRWDATLGETGRGLDASARLLDGAAWSYESTDRAGAAGLFRPPPLLPRATAPAPP